MRLFSCALLATTALASLKPFSVRDDYFAHPEYEVTFPESYVLETDAELLLSGGEGRWPDDDPTHGLQTFELVKLRDQSYLCSIPKLSLEADAVEGEVSVEEKKKELVRAADRGWQLLKGMESKQCLYYTTGWWSYSLCYNSEVKQFHSLQPGTAGGRIWPPQEDPQSPSFVLGKYNAQTSKTAHESDTTAAQPPSKIEVKAESPYLVQNLDGGTPCDLTGKYRRIEVQYHCHPQSVDRIGWIKETSTCSYQMVVYTPRLCADVAFLPQKAHQSLPVECRTVIPFGGTTVKNKKSDTSTNELEVDEQKVLVGGVEVGAMSNLGSDGKKLERGRIVMTAEEKAEVVLMSKDGQIQGLSKSELEKLSLDPAEVQAFKVELQKIAGNKDWKITRLANNNGQVELRGIVSNDGEDSEYRLDDGTDEGDEDYQEEL